jgi:hypothetical protein
MLAMVVIGFASYVFLSRLDRNRPTPRRHRSSSISSRAA